MKPRIMLLCCMTLYLFIGTSFCNAEDNPDPCKKIPSLIVTKVEGPVKLGNDIFVTVRNLPDHLEKCGKVPNKFKLYLDWMRIDEVDAKLVPGKEGKLLFKIKHGDSEAARKAWAALLGNSFFSDKKFETPVIVSVGYDKEPPVPVEPNEPNSTLIIVNPRHLGLFVAFMAAMLIVFVLLAIYTGIIRGPFPDIDIKKRPFSLGRAQMAFWFFLVVSSYFFIWLITGNLNTITGSVLTLIGISTATYLSAAALSSERDKKNLAERRKLQEDIEALKATIEELDEKIKETPLPDDKHKLRRRKDKKAAEKEQLHKKLDELKDKISSNGALDFISDENGVSLNRFQIAVWTLVLGLIFVISVFKSMAMPKFDETLLALMGISGGTYVGFKFPSAKSKEDAQ